MSNIQQVRDSLDVLYDLYANRPASKDVVQLGIRIGDMPDSTKTKSLLEYLRQEAGKQEIAERLTEAQKKLILDAGESSRQRRSKK